MKRYENIDFVYDPSTGKLWHARNKGLATKAGDVVTTRPAKNGHLYTSASGKKLLQHTIVYMLMTGKMPTGVIHHKNGDKTNLKWSNLEHITRSKLARKYTRRSYLSSTDHRGVYYKKDRKKYIARISIGGFNRSLGSFENLDDAIKARKEAELKYDYTKG